MVFDTANINNNYSLAKDKKTGDWKVGQWANQALWSVDGSNRRIRAYREMNYWRYFRQTMQYNSEVELHPGDRVAVEVSKTVTEWYYVICSTKSDEGKFKYVIGL